MLSDGISWPHAPTHRLGAAGTYFVTGSTYQKAHLFRSSTRLTLLQKSIVELAAKHGWQLEAWAVFSNHYHFIGRSPDEVESAESLTTFLREMHSKTAIEINAEDQVPQRRVWYNFRETLLTFEKSYFARLNYTHQNPVHHGLARVASQYPWCSAAWFEQNSKAGVVKAIYSFNSKRVRVVDDFTPVLPDEE
jgi:putative transposase